MAAVQHLIVSLPLALFFISVLTGIAGAQTSGPVLLQLRPHPGDTLRLRIDQTIEMSRATEDSEDAFESDGVASLVMLARMAVESADSSGSRVTALTDSVRITSPGIYASSGVLRGAQALQGTRLSFQVTTDGSTRLNLAKGLNDPGVGNLFSQLPATLPKEALMPGASWQRVVQLPLPATPHSRGSATLNATFVFDSLSHSGEFAHLSVRGRLSRSGATGAGGGQVQTSGEVSGSILIDRRRGWISDARTVVTLRSLVSTRDKRTPPSRVRVKITQWMRVL